jgi:hypothetical protein
MQDCSGRSQEKIIVCGAGLNALGMAVALRFIAE